VNLFLFHAKYAKQSKARKEIFEYEKAPDC
jgi:hypothetical protein